MKRSILRFAPAALLFAASMSAASAASASATCTTSKGEVTINDTTSCHFETSGGCSAKCTPLAFTATCGGSCSASADGACTSSCETTCNTECTKQPDTFTCKGYCTVDCQSGCASSCSGDTCSTQCQASCDTRCAEKCTVHEGATDCTTKCQDSCTGACTVKANIACDVDCTSALTGGCTAKCSQPKGGLFCDGQYIDISDVSDCNFSFSVNASGELTGDAALGCICRGAPGRAAPSGPAAGLVALLGVGLLAARRRRPAKRR
jgi:MYXO-CTERM domain-containing protein